jgi:NADPH2:quinone reductase
MQAIEVDAFGGPERLILREVPMLEPGPGEVLVKAAYAGVNYTDIYRSRGDYAHSPTYTTPLPFRLGVEGGGTIAALGAGVTVPASGARVAYTRITGAYAEYVTIPAGRAVTLPDGVPLDRGVALMSHGITAHYLSHDAFPLKAEDSCLVHAGAGGVGQMLIQLAKMRGATVYATVGSPEKMEVARQRGADAVILYRQEDFREAVMKLTDGRGVDVVYDSVGKDTILKSLNSLRVRGVCVLYGHASGIVENLPPLELAEAGSVYLTRPHLQHYLPDDETYQRRLADLLRWLGDGKIDVTIDRVFPLAAAADALRAMENRTSRGKLLIEIAPEA